MAEIPTASHQNEATIVSAHRDSVWGVFKNFQMDKLNADVTNVTFVDGSPGTVGSHVQVTFQDGAVWNYHILEVSELHHRIVFEVIFTEPAVSFHSSLNTVRLFRDTVQEGKTFVQWETDFSSDASAEVIMDCKYKKRDSFNRLNEHFAAAA